MPSNRDLGSMGENTVKVWCDQEGISANKAAQDKTGWDLFLEFPGDDNVSLVGQKTLDLLPGILQCMVQVKSTDQQPNKWDIKLDNWQRFVKTPLPCFFLFLEFAHTNECQRAYIVHVWENEIRQVLKRLRELSVKNQKELHKTKLSLPYKRYTQLSSNDGRGLAKAIKDFVKNSMEEYAESKNKIVRSIGYEDGDSIFEISVLPTNQENFDIRKYLVDFAIGLVPYLEITQAKITDIRFGIRAPEPRQIIENARLGMERQSVGFSQLQLYTPDRKQELTINMVIYAPNAVGVGPDSDLIKYRLSAPYLDFILLPRSNDSYLTYHFPDLNESMNIFALKPSSEFILFISQLQGSSLVGFDIIFEGQTIGNGQMTIDTHLHQDTIYYCNAVIGACKIIRAFGLQENMFMKAGYLLKQHASIQLAGFLLNDEKCNIRVEFRPDIQEDDENFDDAQLYCCPIVNVIFIGEYRIIISLVAIGDLAPTGEIEDGVTRLRMITSDVRLQKKYITNKKIDFHLTIKELMDEAAAPFKDEMPILLMSNFLTDGND